jgi:glycosyltransferase involved in cell wall biosynthesis
MKTISIITPCYNEEENVTNCALRVRQLFESKLPEYNYEHIFSDNSSTDKTAEVLISLAQFDPRIRVIINSRNVGPFRNMWSAMKQSSGDAVVPFLPADLQDPPEIIENFIRNWEQGSLVVYGIRKKRQENFPMRLLRGIYYRVISLMSDFEIPRNVGEFLLVDRQVLNSVLEVEDEYPYVRGLIAQTGVKSTSVAYLWRRRKYGKSKISLLQLLDQAINGLISTSRAPARIALLSGFMLALSGVVASLIYFIKILFFDSTSSEFSNFFIPGIFFLSGIQLFFLGLIGEYILSIHAQIRKVPKMYPVKKVNFHLENFD